MERKIETLIVGATYFGIGYASAHPECMIIESAQMLGTDFHPYVRTADMSKAGEKEENSDLGRKMRELKIWESGKFDVLKASLAIHQYVSQTEQKLRVLLDAKLISIERLEDEYRVTYIDNEGIHRVKCGRILDTTLGRDTDPASAVCTAKSLNLFTVSTTEGFEEKLKKACPECVIELGVNPGEKIVKIPFHPHMKILSAYAQVVEIWKKAFPEGGEKILFVAEDFERTCEAARDGEALCDWNGGRFANPLTAFAEGMQYSFS